MIKVEKYNLATHIPEKLTVYEFLTELNLEQLNDLQEMVKEVKIEKYRNMYLVDEDYINADEAFYRWKLNECFDEGAEQIWFECKDYLYEGKPIVVHKELGGKEEWTIQFVSIQEKYSSYVGNCSHYLKDEKEQFILSFKNVNDAIKEAEKYIRENKVILGRI